MSIRGYGAACPGVYQESKQQGGRTRVSMGAFWGGSIWHLPIGRLEGAIQIGMLASCYWLLVDIFTYVSMFLKVCSNRTLNIYMLTFTNVPPEVLLADTPLEISLPSVSTLIIRPTVHYVNSIFRWSCWCLFVLEHI